MNPTSLPITSLYRTLSSRQTPDLLELAKRCQIRDSARMQTEELTASIFEALLDMGRLAEVCYSLDPETWELFQWAANEPLVQLTAPPAQYRPLAELCYLECAESGEDCFAFVPDEIKAALFDLIAGGLAEQKALFDAIHTCAQISVSLYGVIGLKELTALFNRQNGQSLSVEELEAALLRRGSADGEYFIWKDYLADAAYRDDPQRIAQIISELWG